jgi:hypothetical protein
MERIGNLVAEELGRLYRLSPSKRETPEKLARIKRLYDNMMNGVCRREGIIIPIQQDRQIIILPPQVALADCMTSGVSQINTYEIGVQE